MLINEVCRLTGLTKKAVSYYEKQGLIKPCKGDNGYREYLESEVSVLNEISLYRKLDIDVKDIKRIINSSDKKSIISRIIEDKQNKAIEIKKQKMYLETILNDDFSRDSIKKINEEVIEVEKNNSQFIKNELIRSFPGGIGLYLAYHFAPYLNEPIDTAEKYAAWIKIAEFLDSVPDIKVPKIIQKGYEDMTEEMVKTMNDNMRNEIDNMLNADSEELEKYKKKILQNIEKQNDISLLKIMNPFNKFKKQLNDFFSSSGYYDIFIPSMKILSRDYKEYHDKLMRLNDKLSKELGIRYDENMKVVIEKNMNK